MNRKIKRRKSEDQTPHKSNNTKELKRLRNFLSAGVPLEVDLETRKIILPKESVQEHNLEMNGGNIDSFIKRYIHPDDSSRVNELLLQAGRGVEKPIQFNFVVPGHSRQFTLEFRFTIEYVHYAHTRLRGLVIMPSENKEN